MNNEYEQYKKKTIKNLKYYLVFNLIFVLFNLVVIKLNDSYSFPKNFFAIWPIIGWGIPTLSRFINLKRMKKE